MHLTFISHMSWMYDIPDETPLTALSLPGTHNSCCIGGPFGFAQTQDLDLPHQLLAGVRFLDIRLAHYQDNLFVHHDLVDMEKCYSDILDICSDFLCRFPSETIIMSIKDERRCDSILGGFAPSEVFGKNSEDPMDRAVVRSDSFEGAFIARTWQHVDDASLFYNFKPALPGDDSASKSPRLISETTLENIRGQIVLLRRFEGGEDIGFDLTYWPENQTFRSSTSLIYDVHDCYQGLGSERKRDLIVAHLEDAKRRGPKDLYITFTSAVNLKARGYAKTINPCLNDYLARSSKGRVGIVVMDYFHEPRELVSNVIRMN